MKPRNPNAEPKPFIWIHIPREAPQRSAPATHERFTGLTGKLGLSFTVVSEYLFIGSGSYEFDPKARGDRPDVWYTFYRRNEQICVPGTSLKGAIRAIVEAISNSCISQYRRRRDERVSPYHKPCQSMKKLCPACRLFGTTGFRGRVHFADALPAAEAGPTVVKISELWEPRISRGRKFYEVKQVPELPDSRPQRNCRFVEAMPKETRFCTTLHFENLIQAELGLLFHALGWQVTEGDFDPHAFTPKLGGAKPRCFGAVEFNPLQLMLWKKSQSGLLQAENLGQDPMKNLLTRCLEEARKTRILHEPSWQQLIKGMQKQSRSCPRELY